MRKEFQVGILPESDTEYFATAAEYHVYASDATGVSDSRYAAMRGDATYWFESGPITDLTVENCRFIGDGRAFPLRARSGQPPRRRIIIGT